MSSTLIREHQCGCRASGSLLPSPWRTRGIRKRVHRFSSLDYPVLSQLIRGYRHCLQSGVYFLQPWIHTINGSDANLTWYTAFSELLPLLAVGTTPALKIKKISQSIDSKNRTIVNTTTLASPFATLSFGATASFEVQSPSRIQVQFKEGALQPPEVSSSVNLPEKFEIFGQKIDLQPVERALNPLQQAVANIFRVISGQPPLRLPIPGNRAKSWLLTTYLDRDFRISRGDGGLFVLAKEGSPLLQQLS